MSVTRLLVLAYGAMLAGVGLVGMFTPHWELHALYGLRPAQVPGVHHADLFNQYRFLKAVELGAGLFVLARIGAILAGGRDRACFVALVTAGVAARAIAWVQDGRPSPLFIAFLLLEALVLAAILLHRTTPDAP